MLGSSFGPIDEIASWWSRDGETEIDLLVRSGERLLLVECKWRASGEVRRRDLESLRRHAARTGLHLEGSSLALATAGTFSQRLQSLAQAGEVLLLGPDELFPGS